MIERLFHVVLRVLPRSFRDQFGPEMLETARAIDAERPRRFRRTARAVADALVTPFAVRADLPLAGSHHTTSSRSLPMASFTRDVRFALRALGREPAFTAFVIIALALGIGANAAMFGIADRLLLRGPAHVDDADRVVRLYLTERPAGMHDFTTDGFGYVMYALLDSQSRAFTDVATYAINGGVMGQGESARRVRVGYATAGLFPLLGVQPAQGRFFSAEDDPVSGAARVAVLSDGAWRAWFGAAPDVLGRTVVLNDTTFTVIGVAPRAFTGPQLGPVDAWVPGNVLGARVTSDHTTAWDAQWLKIVGRLAPGVSAEMAAAETLAIYQRSRPDAARELDARFRLASLRANEAGVESTEIRVLRWLTGVAGVVLLIACANVANLLLARGMRRGREVAIRAALGAGRLRVVRLLLIEAVILAFGGAAAGLCIAWLVGGAARRLLFATVEWTSAPVDLRVLAFSTAIAVATGLIVGVVPAIRASRAVLTDTLKAGAREGGGRRSRLRIALTVAQAALSVVLLVGAGLFVHSLWKVRSLDLGIDPDRVLAIEVSRASLARVPEGPARDAERARRRAFYADQLDRVRALPGVAHASVAVGTPFGNRFMVRVRVPGRPDPPRLSTGGASISAVTADYFDTMGTSILRGRGFSAGDGAGTAPVAIVSETMARTLWPQGDAIGECLLIGDETPPCTRIVGVAENTRRSRLREDPVMHYYIPAGQEVGFGGEVLLLRTDGPPTDIAPAVRRLLTAADGSITYVSADTVRSRIEPQERPWIIGATVFALSGVLALVVAGVGLYSVMSYLIADRRHEIGVRLALGARPRDIVRLVLRGSLAMAVIGIVIGELTAASFGRLVAPLLFDTSPREPVVYAGIGALLVIVAAAATLGPARRARVVSPVEVLRGE